MPDAKDLTQGSHEAFRALINSIAPETALERDGKFAPEAIEKLSDKLKELIGEDAIQDFGQQRNERGELVNEEGLPIIDLEEPLPEDDAKESETNSVIQDTPLIRLSSLPSRAREKLRLQRDRTLDILEEEEHEENERQKRVEREEREEIRRKRKQEGANEQARLQRAKELQKKMGKALLQNTKSLDNDGPKEIKRAKDATSQVRNKTVTFVETSDSRPDAQKSNWGNVTAAKLRPGKRPTLLQAFRTDNPLKMNVIERKSAGRYSAIQTPLVQNAKDSDDESEPDGNEFNPRPDDNEGEDLLEEPPDSEEDIGEVELENEYDLDYAQHQREIALQYYEKRNVMGPDVAKNMMNDTYEKEELATDSPNNQPKPSVSRFKASRIASAYGTSTHDGPSASPAASLLPESAARTVQHAVKSGRIDDDNRLIGGGNDTDSDAEAEGLREALDSLRKGELYNLGPNGHLLYTPPQPNDDSHAATLPTSLPTALSGKSTQQDQHTQEFSVPPLNRPKISRFKVDRSQAGRPLPNSPSTVSKQSTPVASPQRPLTKSQNTISETIVERQQFQRGKGPGAVPPAHISQLSKSPSPMIVESSSFSAPISTQPNVKVPTAPFISNVVESSSFPNQHQSADSGTTFFPIVVESPSFPPPGQRTSRPERPPTVVASHIVAHDKPAASKPVAAAIHSQSSPIVASTVQERTLPMSKPLQHDDSPGNESSPTPIKLSRFKQRRDGRP